MYVYVYIYIYIYVYIYTYIYIYIYINILTYIYINRYKYLQSSVPFNGGQFAFDFQYSREESLGHVDMYTPLFLMSEVSL